MQIDGLYIPNALTMIIRGLRRMEQAEIRDASRQAKAAGIPRQERKWLLLACGLAVLIVLTGIWNILQVAPENMHKRSFELVVKNYGSMARIALFGVLVHYVLRIVLQRRFPQSWHWVKQGVVFVSKLARKWHTSLAVIAIGLIAVHATAAFLYGIKLDFHNISGLLALLVLLPVPVSGLLRYRKMDRKWHLRLGLAFAVLFLLHAFI
jgi:hypothetical protein